MDAKKRAKFFRLKQPVRFGPLTQKIAADFVMFGLWIWGFIMRAKELKAAAKIH